MLSRHKNGESDGESQPGVEQNKKSSQFETGIDHDSARHIRSRGQIQDEVNFARFLFFREQSCRVTWSRMNLLGFILPYGVVLGSMHAYPFLNIGTYQQSNRPPAAA